MSSTGLNRNVLTFPLEWNPHSAARERPVEGHLMMSAKERRHMLVCVRVRDHGMSLERAAEAAGLSYRQMRRTWSRFLEAGEAGLIHLSRGRSSSRTTLPSLKEEILERYRLTYLGFGPTLAAEKLACEGLIVDHETLRRWLIASGQHTPRHRRHQHRKARERVESFGQLVQFDGSPHHWFEDRGESCCLMHMIDDATGIRHAILTKSESTASAMRVLLGWIALYGVPEALDTDHSTVYVADWEPTLEEQLAGTGALTAFGRACATLGISIIPASSPQAKGRVERAHGVLQDRFVKELRLAGCSTIELANQVLRDGFLDDLNTRFAVTPASSIDAHRILRRDEDLDLIMAVNETRTVGMDYTVRFNNRILQIVRQRGLPDPKDKVTVALRLDGALHLMHRGQELEHEDVTDKIAIPRAHPEPPRLSERTPQPINRPTADHPWKRWYGPPELDRAQTRDGTLSTSSG